MFKNLKKKMFIIAEYPILEIEPILKSQMKILELRTVISDMKISLNGSINNMLEKTIEKIIK